MNIPTCPNCGNKTWNLFRIEHNYYCLSDDGEKWEFRSCEDPEFPEVFCAECGYVVEPNDDFDFEDFPEMP